MIKKLIDKYNREILCEEKEDILYCEISGILVKFKKPYPEDNMIIDTFNGMITGECKTPELSLEEEIEKEKSDLDKLNEKINYLENLIQTLLKG